MIVHKLWITYIYLSSTQNICDKCQMSSGPYGPIFLHKETEIPPTL